MLRLVIPALLLAGCAAQAGDAPQNDARQQARLARALNGLTPGAPQRCLDRSDYDEVRGFDGTILYVAGRGRVYRNDVTGSCAGLRRGDIVVTRSIGSQACRGDIVQTRAPVGGMLSGTCALGDFVPYTR